MNTQTMRSTIEWTAGGTADSPLPAVKSWKLATPLCRARYFGFRLLLAALPAAVIVVGTVWTVSAFEAPRVLQALVWATGFVFLALAVDSSKPTISALLATGLALPALALLSAQVAIEFVVIAAALVAAWVAAAILKL